MKVWNCEFELKRGFFKEYGIETMDDFIKKQNDIWLYLTMTWLQFKDLTNERMTRCDTNDKWLALSMLKFNENEYKGISRIIQHMTEAENMIPQIAGCITSFAAKKGMIDYDESIKNVLKSIHDYLLYCKGTTYEELVYSKLP